MHASMVQATDHRILCEYVYTRMHIYVYIDISPMHATSVQAIDQRVQIYAIQLIHATIIQTNEHRILHKHTQFNLCMLQSSKHSIKEFINIEKNNQSEHRCS